MPSVGRTDRLKRVFSTLVLVLLSLGTLPAVAQSLPDSALKTGDGLRAIFQPVADDVRRSTVRVLVGGEPSALGVIVSEDGHILTKDSQVRGSLTVRLSDGREFAASRIGRDRESDLALIRITARNLTPIDWADSEPSVGSWLVSVGQEKLPVGIGVVSVHSRRIAAQRGILGIHLGEESSERRPMVISVINGSGADVAGMVEGDVILTVDGRAVPTRREFLDLLEQFRPGDSLPLVIRRGDKEEELLATLGNETTMVENRQTRQNMMAGPLSVRSAGFELALQHDTVLQPVDCGGPVVDLSGRVVGLNIARAGRVESYALPTAAVRPVLERLLASESLTAKN